MAPSFDSAVSSLLCAEDNSSILYDDDGGDDVGGGGYGDEENIDPTWNHRNHRTLPNQSLSFWSQEDFINGVGLVSLQQSDEWLALMIDKELEHLPGSDYLDRLKNGVLDWGARNEVVDWILKVHAHFSFGPLSAYLSINYLDRFLSAYQLPKGKAWMMQLSAVACLSLAAKMEETEVPLSLDLQVGESRFVFEARTIQRMELMVLSTLKWRMQAITPFSFIDHFLRKFNDHLTPPPSSSILASTQLILSTIKGIDLLEFRASEIAAAVAMSVAFEAQTVDSEKAISALIQHVKKERLLKCVEAINKSSSLSGGNGNGNGKGPSGSSVPSVPQSPIGVLDAAACLSYKTEETTTVGSCGAAAAAAAAANSSHSSSPHPKRRKLNTSHDLEEEEP